MEPQVQFCTSADGTSIAYATVGKGMPLLFVPVWCGNVEHEWNHPQYRTFIENLTQKYLYVQWDRRGVGLSQRDVDDISMEAQIADLTAVVDDLGAERCCLFGCHDAGAVAIAFAAKHPERISRLVLWAPYSQGDELGHPDQVRGIAELIRNNWPLAPRAIADFSFPTGPIEEQRWWSRQIRQSASPEISARYWESFPLINVRTFLPLVKAPTLVLHRREDRSVPVSAGRRIAALIRDARFIELEGDMTVPYTGDLSYLESVNRFLEGHEVSDSESVPSSRASLVGRTISHYKILEKLGEGGMGVVYKAEDTKLERVVALKFLSSQALGTEEEKVRFVREAKAAAALTHSNICTVYEINESEGQAFIAMEYIDGKSLADTIESGGFDINEVLDVAIQIAEGLRRAHRRGIIHRDIKSANIILTEYGQARIMDFGLAKLAGKTRLTKTATIMGTVSYMSPEQAHGEVAIDHHTDIWSLGVLLYEMLAGKPPFDAPTDAGLIHKIIYEEPESLSNLRREIPESLGQCVLKMIQKNPQDRYESMDALIVDLKSIRSGATPKIIVEEKSIPSIAVLPFTDMSPQKDQEYFCDGISESIINELTQLSDLRVIARTSAFSFKGQSLDVREIGKKLNVGTVLEGSIQKAGDRVRITAQLVNTAQGEHLWSEKYDRNMEDIFAIQDEITLAIVDELRPKLLGEEKAKLARRQTVDLKAHNLYLKGRYFLGQYTANSLKKAIEYFEQAIALHPDYAIAHAGLAACYMSIPFFEPLQQSEIYPKAKEAIANALQIDDKVAEAHASLAMLKTWFEWDWEGAEREYKKAIELNPGYVIAHNWYAAHLRIVGRLDEALTESRKALTLDPLSLIVYVGLGNLLCEMGKEDEGIGQIRKALEMDPSFFLAHWDLWIAYASEGMKHEAYAELEQVISLEGMTFLRADPGELESLRRTHAKSGWKGALEWRLNQLKERRKQEYVPAFTIAQVCALLDRRNEACEWLERAYEEQDVFLIYIRADLTLKRLHSDPRFKTLLQKMGLEKSDATVPIIESSPSIAVLPFVNMSADPEQEYFCDGLAEELINALTQIKDLHVVARTSAFSFKGQNLDVREIGKKLNVETVLEGSVRKAGNRVRITGQLVKVADGYHLWSNKYDREMEDIFAIQDEIAAVIVDKLKPTLLGEDKIELRKHQTVNLEAYNLYLRGRHFWNRRSEEGFNRAVECFKQAIERAPDYAPAYVGLADCHISAADYMLISPREVFPKAREAALKALEIDDDLAEAHTSLAHIRASFDWDFESAEKEYKRAIELNPGYANAHNWYAGYLMVRGRSEEAFAEIERALELDPFAVGINAHHAVMLMRIGQYDRAIEVDKKTLELDPNVPRVHFNLGTTYFLKGMHEEALTVFQRAEELPQGKAGGMIGKAGVYAYVGRTGEARQILEELLEFRKKQYVPALYLAFVYFLLGEIDHGFDWLNNSCEERVDPFLMVGSPILLDFLNIRSDPRLTALFKKMNLEP